MHNLGGFNMTIKELRTLAATIGATIGTERNENGWGYWLLDHTGESFFPDGSFYMDKQELAADIKKHRSESGPNPKLLSIMAADIFR
jgi:hypothetical protein